MGDDQIPAIEIYDARVFVRDVAVWEELQRVFAGRLTMRYCIVDFIPEEPSA